MENIEKDTRIRDITPLCCVLPFLESFFSSGSSSSLLPFWSQWQKVCVFWLFWLSPVPTLSAGVVTRAYPPFSYASLRFYCHWVENLQTNLKIMTKQKKKKFFLIPVKEQRSEKLISCPPCPLFPLEAPGICQRLVILGNTNISWSTWIGEMLFKKPQIVIKTWLCCSTRSF